MVKFIEKDYIVQEYGLIDFNEEEKADYYILRASRKIAQMITYSGFDETDITNLSLKQQDAIKEATCIYTDYYWKDDFDFTEGSISVNIGSSSFAESRVYNGEKIIPQVEDILQNAGLLETDFGTDILITESEMIDDIYDVHEESYDDTILKAAESNYN